MIKLTDLLKEIEQEQTSINVDNEFAQLGKDLASEVEKILQSNQPQNEDVTTAAQILDIILTAPTMLHF